MFWSVTTLLLLILAKTLPDDQDKMEKELAKYVESKLNSAKTQYSLSMKYKDADSAIFDDVERFKILDDDLTQYGNESIVSIEDRMSSFDAAAARESWIFIEDALREIAILSKLQPDDEDFELPEGEVWDAPPNESEDDEGIEIENQREDRNQHGELDTLL